MTSIAKVIIRGLLGFVAGILSGAIICALEFALLDVIAGGGNRSLGGIGTITNPIEFSALVGAIIGAFYGAIVGVIIGLVAPGPMRGAVAGAVIGAAIAAYLFLTSSDPDLAAVLLWIVITGVIVGLATGTELKLLTKRITWLSK